MSKLRGKGPPFPFSIAPPSPSLMAPLRPCLSQVVSPLRNLTHHWVTSHALGAKQGEVKGGRGSSPTREISFVS